MLKYKRHEYSKRFGNMDDEKFESLVMNMEDNGYNHIYPIVLYKEDDEKYILDGYHRAKAAHMAGIEIDDHIHEYKGDDPLGYAITVNLQRKQFDTTDLAGFAYDLCKDSISGARTDLVPAGTRSYTRDEASNLCGIGVRSIQRYINVMDSGDENLIKRLLNKEISLFKADELLTKKQTTASVENQNDDVESGDAPVHDQVAERHDAEPIETLQTNDAGDIEIVQSEPAENVSINASQSHTAQQQDNSGDNIPSAENDSVTSDSDNDEYAGWTREQFIERLDLADQTINDINDEYSDYEMKSKEVIATLQAALKLAKDTLKTTEEQRESWKSECNLWRERTEVLDKESKGEATSAEMYKEYTQNRQQIVESRRVVDDMRSKLNKCDELNRRQKIVINKYRDKYGDLK